MEVKPVVYCINCDDKKEYIVKAQKREITVKGITFQYVHQQAFCAECGEEVYCPEVNDANVLARENAYRKAAQLITVSEVEQLLAKYNIGAGPLAKIMGIGDVTINRYLCGQLPSKEISSRLFDLISSPALMEEYLESNKKKISPTAYKKCREALDKLIPIYADEKTSVVTRYLLAKSGDITPLALQKLLYYAQSFYYAFFHAELFLMPCYAWQHGPVYPEIYFQFREYGSDPIQKSTESFLKSTSGLTEKEIRFLDCIIEIFGQYSGSFLRNLTHKESPWIEARGDLGENDRGTVEISRKKIHDYFSEIILKYNIKEPKDMYLYIEAMTV